MTDFEVGQTVTVWGGYTSYPVAVSQIARMTTRTISLSNDMKFTDSGMEWGFSNSYGGKRIRPYREGDRETLRRANLVRRLSNLDWQKLSDEQLIKVDEIVKSDDD